MKAEQVETLSDLYEWIHENEDPTQRSQVSSYFNGYVTGAEESLYAQGVEDFTYAVKLDTEGQSVDWEDRPRRSYLIEITVMITDHPPSVVHFAAILNDDPVNPKIIAVRRMISGTPV